ncbi:unnamed protein product, partial [Vitis vinifera]|uniref:Uncharacterized protein n=1 Tax=Vitis vinifera TaxID=29760 RepID=D7UBQ9_VITVI
MNVCHHWICPRIHHGKNWLLKICMEMNGIFFIFFEVNLDVIYSQLDGVFLLVLKD